ncbi:unnamed protein product [Musa acuminata subsp. malaccensis]|uniref:(wild Malaysian banana) hypothetical protein n=1 Tax=Musa acuminata subsp. malaccensis TaxID=214687 RepID=A0A804KGY3_MUSAM|nr:unnamed protein product [Musa acuminata subsp. malaccensis]
MRRRPTSRAGRRWRGSSGPRSAPRAWTRCSRAPTATSSSVCSPSFLLSSSYCSIFPCVISPHFVSSTRGYNFVLKVFALY